MTMCKTSYSMSHRQRHALHATCDKFNIGSPEMPNMFIATA